MKTLREYIVGLEKQTDGLKALAACKSGKAIADLLAKKKITGEVGSSNECPIANYLKSIGFDDDSHSHSLNVSGTGIEITYTEDISIETTSAIDNFISSFDDLDDRDEDELKTTKRKPFAKLMA